MKNSEEIFLDELKEEFIVKLVNDVVSMKEACEKKDNKAIARIAHDIKGTIGIFGYHEGTVLALNLQLVAEEAKWEQIDTSLNKFLEYLRIQEILP